MGNRAEENRPRGAKISGLHDRVAQLYYSHGLFCSTYPISVIFCAISVTLLCCYPLLNLPLSSNPMAMRSLLATFNASAAFTTATGDSGGGGDGTEAPPWCYVQQVVVRAAVLPWTDNLRLGDAFRAPLYEAFKLLDAVRNYEDANSTKSLGHVCLHVENIKKKNGRNDILPEYSCLVLSPANFWRQDVQQFSLDNSILSTVFNYQNIQKGKTSLSEILFGMHLSETGIKRYPLRNRQRIIQYAITLFLKDYDETFIAGLRNKLHTIYPLHQDSNNTKGNILNETVLIHYPGEVNYYEFIPLMITFILLFLYYYFSVRKIEMIKSKIGMAFTVLATVLFSLFMTLGLCFFFGLTLGLQGKEIFPYLVILVGLENVLVLTKSVVTTPAHLDIKIRVAQGLSKEGWSITKNLLIEITILTIGIFTFVPVIQEFCIFAIVGLITDFFLQMLFFSTILGIDTRRMENLVDKTNPNFRSNLYQTHNYEKYNVTGMSRSKSQPRLNNMHTTVVAGQTQTIPEKKIPKRLRLVNIWARTRFFQRAFMILMVTWIAMILYNSGILEQVLLNEHRNNTSTKSNKTSSQVLPILNSDPNYLVNYVTHKTNDIDYQTHNLDELNKLKHPDYSAPWMKLSSQHWPAILRKYNMSLSGLSIAVLPSILLSHAISPEQAILLRNPDEKYGQKFHWQALAAALDPIDFTDVDGQQQHQQKSSPLHHPPDQPFYPSSPVAIALVALLALISCLVLCYAVVVLYKCVCSRHYAEWRASWFAKKTRDKSGGGSSGDEATEVPLLLEAVPVVLDGHREEVECLASDGFSVVSSGLGSGVVKVWDTITGEMISTIDRNTFFSDMNQQKSPDPTTVGNDFYDYDTTYSDYGSGSPPSRDEHINFMSFPSLKNRINTNFVNLHLDTTTPSSERYDFDRPYKQVYQEHEEETRVRNRNHDTVRWLHSTMSNGSCNTGTGGNGVRRSLDAPAPTRRCSATTSAANVASYKVPVPPIWCMDCIDNLIVIGCADGRLEFWEGTTAKFKCLVEDDSGVHTSGVGITSVKIVGSRVIAARLCGTLDFLQLQTYNQGRPIDWNFTSAYRRTHIRTSSAGSIAEMKVIQTDNEDLRCVRVLSTRAHQQPITCLDCEGGNVVTGSADHTLKVFRLDDGSPKYTLHGHCGPITCLFIDRVCPATSGSGSQDGMLCVWDLVTGACMYSVQAHDGPVLALTYSASYVISLGSDERTCVWERFQGHLLNAIALPPNCHAAHLLLLTPHLLVTSRTGGLALWDVRTGDCVRNIVLGHSPYVFVRQLLLVRDAVLCDFGRELRIVRFPLITHKYD